MALGSIETPGDGPAFPELFVDHAGYVERVLRSLGVCEADLPDLRQEVFLVVHRRLDSFEGRSTLRTWLYGICLRIASGHRRRLRRRREQLAAAPPDRGHEPAQHDALLLQQTAELIESALARLPEGQRRAFVLYELEQRPMDEVARKLGCPLKTGFTRLYAARRRVNAALRRALGVAAVLEFAQPQGAHALAPASTAALPTASTAVGGLALAASALLLAGLAAPVPGAALAHAGDARGDRRAPSYALLAQATPAPAAPSAQNVAAPESPPTVTPARFEVEPVELPGVHMIAHRIGLSEVVPVYAGAGQVPALPPPTPAPIQTRLAPRLIDPEHAWAAIDGRFELP